MLEERIKIFNNPECKDPILIAAWPGMGLVGLKTVGYLRERFEAQRIALIEGEGFFQSDGVKVKNGVLTSAPAPKSEFYHIRPEGMDRDILLLIGQEQPAAGRERSFAHLVIDLAEQLNVVQVLTAAAMVTSIHHGEPSRLWIAATSQELLQELKDRNFRTIEEGQIGGLNGLLLDVARVRGIGGYCFLGEIPYYVTNLENPKAAIVILEYLESLLGLEVDLASLREKAAYVEAQIDSAIRQQSRADSTLSRAENAVEALDKGDDDDHGVIN